MVTIDDVDPISLRFCGYAIAIRRWRRHKKTTQSPPGDGV